MSKYKGPRIRLVRRLGKISGLTNKRTDRKARPGQHGRNRHKITQYAVRLLEKQKLRFYYSLTEKQLVSYVKKARTSKRSTSEILFRQLEIRLDNILFRRSFALTLPHARQIVNHSKVKVNRQSVTTPNYFCFVGQTIEASLNFSNGRIYLIIRNYIPEYLEKVSPCEVKVNSNTKRKDVRINFSELLVIEYYSNRLLFLFSSLRFRGF